MKISATKCYEPLRFFVRRISTLRYDFETSGRVHIKNGSNENKYISLQKWLLQIGWIIISAIWWLFPGAMDSRIARVPWSVSVCAENNFN